MQNKSWILVALAMAIGTCPALSATPATTAPAAVAPSVASPGSSGVVLDVPAHKVSLAELYDYAMSQTRGSRRSYGRYQSRGSRGSYRTYGARRAASFRSYPSRRGTGRAVGSYSRTSRNNGYYRGSFHRRSFSFRL